MTANSESGLSQASKWACFGSSVARGVQVSPVAVSWKTAWRWEKVPRLESWPLTRTGVPSRTSEPKASASAVPQSSGRAPSAIFARRASCWTILGLRRKPAGTVVSARPIAASVSRATPVSISTTPSALGAASRGGFAARTARGLLGRRQRRLVHGELARLELLDFLFGHDAFADEPPRVERAHARVGLDRLVHQGLRVGRLVAFVVPVAAEADQVDDDVLVELLPVVESDLEHAVRGLRIVGVDVEDRDLVDLGHVGRVHGGAPLRGRRRESDLVVDDDVDRPARPVARQLGEIEDLGHHPLPGERRVPVEEHRQNGLPGGGAVAGLALLLGADHALDDGVDGLEVRGVRFDLDGDLLAGLGLPDRARALVVLDVALVGREVGMDDALEAREDPLGRVADDVRQDVQPAAVGHADHDLVDAAGRASPRPAGRAAESPSRSPRPSSAADPGTWCRGSARTLRPR